MKSNQIPIPNITWGTAGEITLVNTTNGLNFKIFPRDDNTPYIFQELIINEDMFSESLSGSLLFNDPAYFIDQLNFTTFDQIKIKCTTPAVNVVFKITEVVTRANSISKSTLGPAGTAIPIAINFASDSAIYKNFNSGMLDEFIGVISTEGTTDRFTAKKEVSETPVIDLKDCNDCTGTPLEGFIQYIFKQFGFQGDAEDQKKLISDETINSVWIKLNPSYYPWNKIGASPKISQLINYVCEYAAWKKNPNAVNFFFWEDLDQFNFKCIESILKEPNTNKSVKTYSPTLNEYDEETIISLDTISETEVSDLIKNGAFSGEYIRIKPNWENPYRSIVDTQDSLIKEQYVYDYYSDQKLFLKIAPYPPIDKKFGIDMTLAYSSNRITDSNYGYFTQAYNQKDLPWWNYWDPSFKGYSGAGGDQIKTDRMEENYWQAQFDFSELPASCLKKIYEDIKWPLNDARKEYAQLKRDKTKWNFFKNTIIGEKKDPTSFYAILTSATKILDNGPAGIYSYTFNEVEFTKNVDAYKYKAANEVVNAGVGYPFTVAQVPWGIKGTAYNLNEILNLKYNGGVAGGGIALIAPGISVDLNNNGENAGNSAYPTGFRMRAVGSFKDASEYIGRIVKIDVVNSKMFDVFRSKEICNVFASDSEDKMYLFDVENANDGNCS